MLPVDPNITPALHPGTLTGLEHFNDDTADAIAPAVQALTVAYQGLAAIAAARDAVIKNPTLNDAAKVLKIGDFASKQQEVITKAIDKARTTLGEGISSLERHLAAPLQSSSVGTLSQEIRTHCASLSSKERFAFLDAALNRSDGTTLHAILGAPAYLSGMTNEEQATRTRMYHLQRDPLAAKRLDLMKTALGKLDNSGSLVFNGVTKAMGSTWVHVNTIRAATVAAEREFAVRTQV